uniref:FUN14 domain containing 1 n=1 Tax=Cebus imitator TaxID=2715852 RepID=A0A2K5RXA9_CEBIM
MATQKPPPQKYESDDAYEALDLTEYAGRRQWWNLVFGHSLRPMVEKSGKLAATAVGGGLRLLQIASHSGYVQIDWKRVEKDANKAKRQIKKWANKTAPEFNNLIEEATEFITQNIVISSGFVGGFLLGLAP